MSKLTSDPRWQRFNDTATPCSCCGKTFNGVFDIAFDHPDPWPHGNREESGQDVLKTGEDQLSADLCKWGDFRFIRCTFPLKIIGTDQEFHFGVWGSVNPDNFDRYCVAWKSGNWDDFEGCFSWLTNALPEFDCSEHIACDLYPTKKDGRPQLFAHDDHSELAAAQENGISFDKLLDIYAAAGNDIRPHLYDA